MHPMRAPLHTHNTLFDNIYYYNCVADAVPVLWESKKKSKKLLYK